MKSDTGIERARLRWGCYRGMLELDLLLLPFFDKHFDDLSLDKQSQFKQLLEQPDPDIFAWLMGHQNVEQQELKAIVQYIKDRT